MKIRGGVILDVGAKNSPYLRYLSPARYVRLDISPESHPTIVCDLHDIKLKSRSIDTVLATEVLEHLYNPDKTIAEIYRVLKPGGTLIISTRFIYPYHPDPKDYYRYTQDSLNFLLEKFSSKVIYSHGNRIMAIWQLICHNRLGNFLAPINPLIAKIDYYDEVCPLGYIAVAKK